MTSLQMVSSDTPPASGSEDLSLKTTDYVVLVAFLAVLPFVSRSNVDDTAFLADDLLTTLSNFAVLKDISRTSVLEYRETSKKIREFGRELGAHLRPKALYREHLRYPE